MSSTTATPIQFETAEPTTATSGAECTACRTVLEEEYYEVNGAPICTTCREGLRADSAGSAGIRRVIRAFTAGSAAAIAGALLCFAIGTVTGYEFGIIAIFVGVAVGAAVRWGSCGRGGPLYQAMAVILTYSACVGSYVPGIIDELRAVQVRDRRDEATEAQLLSAAAAPTGDVDDSASVVGLVIIAIVAFAIAVAAPFLAGIQNIIGIAIIAIGVFEAWKINKRVVVAITGPYAMGTRAPDPAGAS